MEFRQTNQLQAHYWTFDLRNNLSSLQETTSLKLNTIADNYIDEIT